MRLVIDFYNKFMDEVKELYYPNEIYATTTNKKYLKVISSVECFSNGALRYCVLLTKLSNNLGVDKSVVESMFKKYIIPKYSIKEYLDISYFREFRVYSEFRKMILDNVSNKKNLESIKTYLGEVGIENPIEFMNEKECKRFYKRYETELLEINHFRIIGIDAVIQGDYDKEDINYYYNLISSCYQKFCLDIYNENNELLKMKY